MVITSENKSPGRIFYRSTHFRYALIYVVITFVVLLFLNIYSFQVSQELFYNSKETSMLEKCRLAATEISQLDVFNRTTVSNAVSGILGVRDMRLVVTDHLGASIYDSTAPADTFRYMILPAIVQAMKGDDVFSWNYQDGAMQSCCAVPIYSYGTLMGTVYIMEFDLEQGALIQTLQTNTMTISIILEILVILYSFAFSQAFTRRLRKIMTSIRIIREGDFTHKLKMGGHDELTVLGDEFNDLTERLCASESQRRQFVSDASHELKTPLASIKLLTDTILQNDMDPETVREFVADIGNEAERLNRMSQKLLSLSKLDSQIDADCEITYLAPTVQQVARMLQAFAANARIELVMDLANDSPVLTYEDDLYQIIFNLVENGIKYNVPGGKLYITLHRQDDNAVLHFQDTGVGIPHEALGNIFERFYRVDKARARKTGGSGLGLSIVRNLVEHNRGTIEVESTLGQGTIFTVSFPIFDVEDNS